jgi:threonine dehydrogenase-like Zn-dependent dehydrogenase
MTRTFAFMNAAKRIILVHQNWRLDFLKSKLPNVEAVNSSQLGEREVPQKLKEMTDGLGPDHCQECVAGEFPKSKKHTAELAAGLAHDTPETLNDMIESVQSFNRIDITGIYIGKANGFNIGSVSLAS